MDVEENVDALGIDGEFGHQGIRGERDVGDGVHAPCRASGDGDDDGSGDDTDHFSSP